MSIGNMMYAFRQFCSAYNLTKNKKRQSYFEALEARQLLSASYDAITDLVGAWQVYGGGYSGRLVIKAVDGQAVIDQSTSIVIKGRSGKAEDEKLSINVNQDGTVSFSYNVSTFSSFDMTGIISANSSIISLSTKRGSNTKDNLVLVKENSSEMTASDLAGTWTITSDEFGGTITFKVDHEYPTLSSSALYDNNSNALTVFGYSYSPSGQVTLRLLTKSGKSIDLSGMMNSTKDTIVYCDWDKEVKSIQPVIAVKNADKSQTFVNEDFQCATTQPVTWFLSGSDGTYGMLRVDNKPTEFLSGEGEFWDYGYSQKTARMLLSMSPSGDVTGELSMGTVKYIVKGRMNQSRNQIILSNNSHSIYFTLTTATDRLPLPTHANEKITYPTPVAIGTAVTMSYEQICQTIGLDATGDNAPDLKLRRVTGALLIDGERQGYQYVTLKKGQSVSWYATSDTGVKTETVGFYVKLADSAEVYATPLMFKRTSNAVTIKSAPYSVTQLATNATKVTPIVITVTRQTKGEEQTIGYTTSGTAIAGTDYVAPSGTVTFGANEVTKTITINPIGIDTLTIDRTLIVTLNDPTNPDDKYELGKNTSATITLKGNYKGTELSVSAGKKNITESGDKNKNSVIFTINRASTNNESLDVGLFFSGLDLSRYVIADITNGTPIDITQTRTVHFGDNELARKVQVTLIPNTIGEKTETLRLEIQGQGSNATRYFNSKTKSAAAVAILDPATVITVKTTDANEAKMAAGSFTIISSVAAPLEGMTVHFTLEGSTATDGTDFVIKAPNGTTLAAVDGVYSVTLAKGQKSYKLTVTPFADNDQESTEHVRLNLIDTQYYRPQTSYSVAIMNNSINNRPVIKSAQIGQVIKKDTSVTLTYDDLIKLLGANDAEDKTNVYFSISKPISSASGVKILVNDASMQDSQEISAQLLKKGGVLKVVVDAFATVQGVVKLLNIRAYDTQNWSSDDVALSARITQNSSPTAHNATIGGKTGILREQGTISITGQQLLDAIGAKDTDDTEFTIGLTDVLSGASVDISGTGGLTHQFVIDMGMAFLPTDTILITVPEEALTTSKTIQLIKIKVIDSMGGRSSDVIISAAVTGNAVPTAQNGIVGGKNGLSQTSETIITYSDLLSLTKAQDAEDGKNLQLRIFQPTSQYVNLYRVTDTGDYLVNVDEAMLPNDTNNKLKIVIDADAKIQNALDLFTIQAIDSLNLKSSIVKLTAKIVANKAPTAKNGTIGGSVGYRISNTNQISFSVADILTAIAAKDTEDDAAGKPLTLEIVSLAEGVNLKIGLSSLYNGQLKYHPLMLDTYSEPSFRLVFPDTVVPGNAVTIMTVAVRDWAGRESATVAITGKIFNL